MLRLRKILLYKPIYYVLFLISLCYMGVVVSMPTSSYYQEGKESIEGKILTLFFDGSTLDMTLFGKEKVKATYQIASEEELLLLKKELHIGTMIRADGVLQKPLTSKNFLSFSYDAYLSHQKISFIMKIESITKIKDSSNILEKVRHLMRYQPSSLTPQQEKINAYIKTFLVGNKDGMSEKVLAQFRQLSISHLFALSGMHLSLLSLLMLKLLRIFSISEPKKFISLCLFLFCYYLLVDQSASIQRAFVSTIVFQFNKTFDFHIDPFPLVLFALSLLFFWNPFLIYEVGFQYSATIAFGLYLYFQKRPSSQNYLKGLLHVSWVSFLLGLPISLYHFSYCNIGGIFYNLGYVPLISFVLFPLSLLTFFLPFLSPLLGLVIAFLEASTTFFTRFSLGSFQMMRLPLYVYLGYFLLVSCYLYHGHQTVKKGALLLLVFCFFWHAALPTFITRNQMYMIDVGQGDSFLFLSEGKSMLVDTGGKLALPKKKYQSGREKQGEGIYIVQFLKALGLSKLDALLLSHGDSDHAQEALTLLDELPVGTIYFNNNRYNTLEKDIISKAKKRKISYRKVRQDEMITIGNYHFQVLSQDLKDENDSSIILLGEIFQYKMLFMGDASKKSENELLKQYDLSPVTILKAGHHGSKTSSSRSFLNAIRPRYTLISAGLDNSFGHPSKEVLTALKTIKTTVFRTDQAGMVLFDFSKQKICTFQNKDDCFFLENQLH